MSQVLTELAVVARALDRIQVGACAWDRDGRTLAWNPAFLGLLAAGAGPIEQGEPLSSALARLQPPAAGPADLQALESFLRQDGAHLDRAGSFGFDTGQGQVRVTAQDLAGLGRVSFWRRDAPPAASDSDAIVRNYRLFAEFTGDVIALVTDGRIEEVSPSVGGLLGWQPAELAGTRCSDLLAPEHATMLDAAFALGMTQPFQARARHLDGSDRWVEISIVKGPAGAPTLVVAMRDISARKAAEMQLQHASRELEKLAHTDALTGAANRRSFDARLDAEWRRMSRDARPLALVMFDLDFFKQLNDQYGHPAGDEVLRRLAARLRDHARRPGDVHARYGGEEFALILPGATGDAAVGIADSVRRDFSACFADRPELATTVSVGVAIAPEDAESPAQLLKRADQALYRAKAMGRNRLVKWAPSAG